MRYLISIFMLATPSICFSQDALANYVQLALANNSSLKAEQFRQEKQYWAQQEAKNFFLPTVGFGLFYTTAEGGRQIGIPVGDVINPVYATLNQLTGVQRFPAIGNINEQLFPRNFYDARFRISQPVLNPELKSLKKIRNYEYDRAEQSFLIQKRELVKKVKIAYIRFLQSQQSMAALQSAFHYSQELVRMNEALLRAGIATPSSLNRARAAGDHYQALMGRAAAAGRKAQQYFNFLVNVNFDSVITIDSGFLHLPPPSPNQGLREELRLAGSSVAMAAENIKLKKAKGWPRLYTSVDIGSQEFDFRFSHQSRYLLFNAGLEINIFSGNRIAREVKQAQAELKAANAQAQAVASATEFEMRSAAADFDALAALYRRGESRVSNAADYQKEITKKYQLGLASFVEVIDGQNQYLQARLDQVNNLFDAWIAYFELERATASSVIK